MFTIIQYMHFLLTDSKCIRVILRITTVAAVPAGPEPIEPNEKTRTRRLFPRASGTAGADAEIICKKSGAEE